MVIFAIGHIFSGYFDKIGEIKLDIMDNLESFLQCIL